MPFNNGQTLVPVRPIAFDHAAAVATLPVHHTDPFDRMLIAQAIVEGCTPVTADPQFERITRP